MSATSSPQVTVHSAVGRKGIPASASFAGWVRAALRGRRGRVDIALLDETAARALNRRDRGKDYATNVLSYRYEPLRGQNAALLGDLVLCAAVVAREAAGQGKPLRDHYAHLTVHGVLHLLGHDHENKVDAERMEALERRILARLGIPDPYVIDREQPPGTRHRPSQR